MGMSNPCRRMTGTHPARHEASGEALVTEAAWSRSTRDRWTILQGEFHHFRLRLVVGGAEGEMTLAVQDQLGMVQMDVVAAGEDHMRALVLWSTMTQFGLRRSMTAWLREARRSSMTRSQAG